MSDINPSTGLPTINGAGSPDICGNSYGVSNNDVSYQHSHIQDSICNKHNNSDVFDSINRNKGSSHQREYVDKLDVNNIIGGIIAVVIISGWLYILLK